MFGRKKPVTQNAVVAKHMNRFFNRLEKTEHSTRAVAEAYVSHLFHQRSRRLVNEKKFARSPFHIGLGVHGGNFTQITKRATLVSDTLLLSHNRVGERHRIKTIRDKVQAYDGMDFLDHPGEDATLWHTTAFLEVLCPDLDALGRWIVDAEPLLRAGLVWYLPSYAVAEGFYATSPNVPREVDEAKQAEFAVNQVPTVLDFLVHNGKAVAESDAHPVKSSVVRPVLTVDLPFIDGVSLRDFGKITIDEFAAYANFRSFLRQTFLDLDDAVHAVQSERKLVTVGQRIEDEIRGIEAQMAKVRRKRTVAVTGAGIGTVGATLVAVYGPAFAQALAILGAAGAGGVWGIIQTAMDNSPRALRHDRWYYVWALAKRANRP
ncbi:hypothetical protein [Kibdelosporangium aridum]|uniref:hypothetical protein n=1 Tax=Kibdelosporangium aridum TaxID=2030 RepID=UPI000691C2F8